MSTNPKAGEHELQLLAAGYMHAIQRIVVLQAMQRRVYAERVYVGRDHELVDRTCLSDRLRDGRVDEHHNGVVIKELIFARDGFT